QHLATAPTERLRHCPKVFFAHVHGQVLDGLHPLAVDPLDDGLRARDLELVTLPPHRLDEHSEVQLATTADQEPLRRADVVYMKAQVGVELLVEPGAQLARGRELAFATGER